MKKITSVCILMLNSFGGPLWAHPLFVERIEACQQKAASATRLSCYDALAAEVIAKTKQQTAIGSWKIETTPSLLNKHNTVSATLECDNPIKSRTQTVCPRIQLWCEEGTEKVFIHWGVYLGKNRSKVSTRLGDNKAETQYWNIENDNRTVRYTGDVAAWIKQLAASNQLVAQISPYNAAPIAVTFTINGFSEAVKAFSPGCEW